MSDTPCPWAAEPLKFLFELGLEDGDPRGESPSPAHCLKRGGPELSVQDQARGGGAGGQLQRENSLPGLRGPLAEAPTPRGPPELSERQPWPRAPWVGVGHWAGPGGGEAAPFPGTRHGFWVGVCLNTREVNWLETNRWPNGFLWGCSNKQPAPQGCQGK